MSVGLLGMQSLIGAAVVLGVALFYIVAVPVINGLVKGQNPFEVGQPYIAFDSYQFTPQEGWDLVSSNDLFVTLGKEGSNVVFTELVSADQTPEEAILTAIDALAQDQANSWVIGGPTAFVTNDGDHGVSATSHSTTQATQIWVITDGTSNLTVFASSPESVWVSLNDEIVTMVQSIVFLSEEESQ